jgi:hypothetical protein
VVRCRNLANLSLCTAVVLALAAWPDRASPQAQSASYALIRQTTDGGGGRIASAAFSVDATIGQPDAGPAATSATFTLRGGFHRPLPATAAEALFRNGFEP